MDAGGSLALLADVGSRRSHLPKPATATSRCTDAKKAAIYALAAKKRKRASLSDHDQPASKRAESVKHCVHMPTPLATERSRRNDRGVRVPSVMSKGGGEEAELSGAVMDCVYKKDAAPNAHIESGEQIGQGISSVAFRPSQNATEEIKADLEDDGTPLSTYVGANERSSQRLSDPASLVANEEPTEDPDDGEATKAVCQTAEVPSGDSVVETKLQERIDGGVFVGKMYINPITRKQDVILPLWQVACMGRITQVREAFGSFVLCKSLSKGEYIEKMYQCVHIRQYPEALEAEGTDGTPGSHQASGSGSESTSAEAAKDDRPLTAYEVRDLMLQEAIMQDLKTPKDSPMRGRPNRYDDDYVPQDRPVQNGEVAEWTNAWQAASRHIGRLSKLRVMELGSSDVNDPVYVPRGTLRGSGAAKRPFSKRKEWSREQPAHMVLARSFLECSNEVKSLGSRARRGPPPLPGQTIPAPPRLNDSHRSARVSAISGASLVQQSVASQTRWRPPSPLATGPSAYVPTLRGSRGDAWKDFSVFGG